MFLLSVIADFQGISWCFRRWRTALLRNTEPNYFWYKQNYFCGFFGPTASKANYPTKQKRGKQFGSCALVTVCLDFIKLQFTWFWFELIKTGPLPFNIGPFAIHFPFIAFARINVLKIKVHSLAFDCFFLFTTAKAKLRNGVKTFIGGKNRQIFILERSQG